MTFRTAIATSALVAAALIAGSAHARGGVVAEAVAIQQEAGGPLVYTSAAYTRPIPGSPNPAPETASPSAEIVYTDQAYGQAIHGYPTRGPLR
jgi:hypothetical protein